MMLVPQIKRAVPIDTPLSKVIDTLLYAVAIFNGGLADEDNPWIEVGEEHSYYTDKKWMAYISHIMTVNQIEKICDEHRFDFKFCHIKDNLFWLQDSLFQDTLYIYAKDCK